MDEKTKQEERAEEQGPVGPILKGIEGEGWRVTDEEIDLVIKKLEEGWSY